MKSPRDNRTRGESYKDIAQRSDSNIISRASSLLPHAAQQKHKASLYYKLYILK